MSVARMKSDARMRAHYGAVAQLGERRVRIAKVEGSIPFRSTNLKRPTGYGRAFSFAGCARRDWPMAIKSAVPTAVLPFQSRRANRYDAVLAPVAQLDRARPS